MKHYKVSTRKGQSDPMTLAEAEKAAQQIKRGAVTILREGGAEDFHPHPDNKGKFYLFRIVR